MFQFQGPVTPAEVSATLKDLIEELVPGGNAIYVAVRPVEDAPPNECFPLVEGHAKKFGGRALVGWALWEFPTLFVEAEFHSVWEMPTGGLVDIAPKQRETQQVFFLHDPDLKYEGRQLDNVRKQIKQDPLLFGYLKTFEAEFELMNRGDRANLHGEITLEGIEAQEFQAIMQRRAAHHYELQSMFPVAGPYHPCPCGSGKKIKWCHKDICN